MKEFSYAGGTACATTTSPASSEVGQAVPRDLQNSPYEAPCLVVAAQKQNREKMYSAGRRGHRIFVMSKISIGLAAHHE
jgi:hypothetical protein